MSRINDELLACLISDYEDSPKPDSLEHEKYLAYVELKERRADDTAHDKSRVKLLLENAELKRQLAQKDKGDTQ